MYISKEEAKREDWDSVKSWNYKLPHLAPKMSVVYAEVVGEHGEVSAKDSEWVYYIIEGSGKFTIGGVVTDVSAGDVITVPPNAVYDYESLSQESLKVVMFIDLWNN